MAAPMLPGYPDAPVMIGCDSLEDVPGVDRVGFKAHNLARMAALGMRVPAAFVLGTRWCFRTPELRPTVWRNALARLEEHTGLAFGNSRRPLLLSVRSGAPVSMPGMMDTLLNIGLTDATLPGLIRLTGNPRLAWDAYRRLIAGYGEIVRGIAPAAFDADRDAIARDLRVPLDFAQLRRLAQAHLATFQRECGAAFPQDAETQLGEALAAVFASWQAPRAVEYRRLHDIAPGIGTAVMVQRMVFGNAGGLSGAGVGFSRHPATGEPSAWVDFLFDAQGEDVVSGRRSIDRHAQLAAAAPLLWAEVLEAAHQLEAAFRDLQEFEFTVQDGALYMLQARAGKRTPVAAARIALDLCDAGVITPEEALRRTAGFDAESLAVARLQPGDAGAPVLARAASASCGVASGEAVFDEDAARARRAAGAQVILLRRDAEAGEIAALDAATGLLTRNGARTSHAAVVARALGKVCLVGCEALRVDLAERRAQIGDASIVEGDLLTLDGNEGAVYRGALRAHAEVPAGLMERLAALRDAATQVG